MANYRISGGFADTQDNLKDFKEKHSASDSGPYIGVVKNTIDPLKMGRLGVVIPALSKTDGHDINASQVIWCQYLSPFYGAKPFKANTSEPYGGQQQRTYGMWAVPPDVDTNVLVIFAKGEQAGKNAFWIGCIQEPLTNQTIPTTGATVKAKLGVKAVHEMDYKKGDGTGEKSVYGTNFLPVEEKNKKVLGKNASIQDLKFWEYPVNTELADQLLVEGLILDDIRGTTSSSARRESPSQVFGMNTPGPYSTTSRTLNIGLDNFPIEVDRTLGHSFVMDDGDEDGFNQLTRIRSASGHQILMHDTKGTVYIANGSGKAFIEMESNGKINIYSNQGISVRTEGDFNLHSDKNIQFHAKEKIKFTSEDTLNLYSEHYLHLMGDSGVFSSSQRGSIRHYGRDGITSYTPGQQMHGASSRIDLAGSSVHLNSRGASSYWGPGWLKPDHERVGIRIAQDGNLDIDSTKPINNGLPNKRFNKTTVTDFVTHEPYTRITDKHQEEFVNATLEEIKKENPDLSSTELNAIKKQLQKATTIDGVVSVISTIKSTNPAVVIKNATINKIKNKAEEVKTQIKNQISSAIKGAVDSAVTKAKDYFF